MNVNKKIFALVLGLGIIFCTCQQYAISNPFTENVPDSVNQAVISRVNLKVKFMHLGLQLLPKKWKHCSSIKC